MPQLSGEYLNKSWIQPQWNLEGNSCCWMQSWWVQVLSVTPGGRGGRRSPWANRAVSQICISCPNCPLQIDSLKGEYAHLGSRIALQAMMRTKYLRGCYFAGWCNTAAIFPWAKGKYSIIS